jgi:hypothetical protein
MKKHWRKVVAIALLVGGGVALSLLLGFAREPIFRGKTESYWITNIVYRGADEQIDQWRSFGFEGVQLLTRNLDRGAGWQLTYRKLYRRYAARVPGVLVHLFPDPVDNRATRMCVLSLLTSLSSRETNIARLAEPAVARAMTDDNPSLRQIAVGFYDGMFRQHMDAEVKKARLRDFLRLAQDDDHWVRGNAAIALSYFPDEAAAVAPVLVKILPEPHPHLQLTIARSLVRVDREAAAKAGVAAVAVDHLKDPEKRFQNPALQRWDGWEIARQAAEVLGELHAEPAVSVPALVEGIGATNREIAIASFRALVKFADQSPDVLPVLRKAAEREDIPNWVKADLVRIDPPAAKP